MRQEMLLLCFTGLLVAKCQAQMWNGVDTLFGNEWINYSQTYLKIAVSEDGVYRIPYQTLANAGVPLGTVQGQNFSLFHYGVEQPLFTSTNGVFNLGSYIEFYGEKNKGQLDKYLYADPANHANPYFSMFSDTAIYYLTWDNAANHLRFQTPANDLNNLPASEPYFWEEQILNFDNFYDNGAFFANGGGLHGSDFESGEGFSRGLGNSINYTFQPANIYTAVGGPQAEFSVNLSANNFALHDLAIRIGNTTYVTDQFSYAGLRSYNFSTPVSALTANNTIVNVATVSGNNADRYGAFFFKLRYPRAFSLANSSAHSMNLSATGGERYLQVVNFNAQGTDPLLFDLSNRIRMVATLDNGTVRAKLPTANGERRLFLVSQGNSGIKNISTATPVTFTNFNNVWGDYIMLSNKEMLGDGNNWASPLLDYAAYRTQTGYTPILVDVNEIYDQFGYGVKHHQYALRNFASFVVRNWNTVKYLFIIGKGRNLSDTRTGFHSSLLVPTFGSPESDNLISATHANQVPRIATGRIAVTNAQQVTDYLNKVRDYDDERANAPSTISGRSWIKRALHLGGGSDEGEVNQFQGYLNNYRNIIEDCEYAAGVESFFKSSNDPIQIAQSELLDSLINDGTSLLTFFGHSAPNTWDFNIDNPENYENYRRYFTVLSLGCYAGQIFTENYQLSERFILTPDKAAVGFIAATGLAYASALYSFGLEFYRNLSYNFYGKGLGTIMQESLQDMSIQANQAERLLMYTITLHGDPAVVLASFEQQDYAIDNSSYEVQPTNVTTNLDSFHIALTVTNIGNCVDTAYWVNVQRTYPNGTQEQAARVRMIAPNFQGTILLPIITGGSPAVGVNTFTITVDADNEVAEGPLPAAEQNNTVTFSILILADEIRPVWPPNFGIVPAQGVTLKASTANAFAAAQNYYLEIDTTELFNSPLKLTTVVNQAGGLVEWTPPLTMTDSTVYYWRVSVDPANTVSGNYEWKGHSFIYLINEFPGWNQSHYYQYLYDEYANVSLPANRVFKFIDDFQTFNVEAGVTADAGGNTPQERIGIAKNNFNFWHNIGCTPGSQQGALAVCVIDPINLLAWQNPAGGLYGSYNCYGFQEPVFLFNTDSTTGRGAMMNFIENTIPDSHYVFIFSIDDYSAAEWQNDQAVLGNTLTNVLQAHGATAIANAANGLAPYIFFFKKGNLNYPGTRDVLGDSIGALLQENFVIPGSWYKGNVNSTVIGPAADWGSIHWRTSTTDGNPQNDKAYIEMRGIDVQGNETVIYPYLQALDSTLNFVDAATYPYLRLVYHVEDSIDRTCPQLDYWRVLYKLLPEAALRPETYFAFEADTLPRGEQMRFAILMQNISTEDMDSMLVKYVITDAGNNSQTFLRRYRPLPAGDTLTTSFTAPATQFGVNRVFVEINPDNDQPEQYHFNNIAFKEYYVNGDLVNPLMDVTFDGIHIFNDDIVSAKPEILITLKDENPYLALNDTSDIELRIVYPDGTGERRIYFAEPYVQFIPADTLNLATDNKAQVILNPFFEQDGTYTLRVLGQDRSGNSSGTLSYNVDFQVINNPSVSNVLNYPNPFSTSTRFVFTLTGAELPDYMKIQIMTISGKIVREIMLDELGDLHVGQNITDFAWDGTDEHGDQLANGIYLYRVVTRDENGQYDTFNTPTNQYFHQGFGKMYLLR